MRHSASHVISLSNMDIAAINSHAMSKKHIQWLQSSSIKSEAQSPMLDFLSSSKTVKVQKKPVDLSAAANGNIPPCKDDSNEKTPEPNTPNTEGNPTIPPQVNEEMAQEMLNIPPPPDSAGNKGLQWKLQVPPTLSSWLQNKETITADILWALQCVLYHYSFKSNEDTSDLFAHMFWDRDIAKNYSFSRTKLAYLITFG